LARGPARASWSGLLRLSLLTIPVKAYPAAAAAPDVPCHQLHAGCGQRIRYEKRCPVHGPVEAGALVKGYAYAPGRCLVLDEAELERLRPANERALTLERCLDPGQLDPALFAGRTLHLTPDGPAARPALAVLAHALAQRRRAALGRVVLSGRRQLVLVRPAAGLLAAHLLHYPAQLRDPAALAAGLAPGPVGDAEARLAGAVLDACGGPVRWADYRDDSAERLAALVEAKLRGEPPAAPAAEEAPVVGLLEALRRSVAALRPPAPPAAAKPRRKSARRSA
jgi:DNA end-binding protein Ku